jgi:hypothetical protein
MKVGIIESLQQSGGVGFIDWLDAFIRHSLIE